MGNERFRLAIHFECRNSGGEGASDGGEPSPQGSAAAQEAYGWTNAGKSGAAGLSREASAKPPSPEDTVAMAQDPFLDSGERVVERLLGSLNTLKIRCSCGGLWSATAMILSATNSGRFF